MDNALLETAAMNFDSAQRLSGPSQIQRIALGLLQVARAAKIDSRDPELMETAATNFDNARGLIGQSQIQRVALGLAQFARALKQ